MKRSIILILFVSFYLAGCSTKATSSDLDILDKQEVSIVPTQLENIQSEFAKEFPGVTSDELTKQINSHMETVYRWVNFNAYSEDKFYFPNSTITYNVYYAGAIDDNSSDKYVLVKLNIEDGIYPKIDYEVVNQTFILYSNGALSAFEVGDKSEDLANDTSLEEIAEGEFTIGDPYNPRYQEFEGKEKAFGEIKDLIQQRYFTNNVNKPENQPIFYDKAKATEVYVRDFDEECIKYDEFRMLVYTDNGYVYQAVLWYCEEDKKFMCQEFAVGSMIYYKVADLQNAKDGELKDIADYYERIKTHSILIINK